MIEKTWGYELWIHNDEKYCGKKLVIYQDKKCSLHYHKLKTETFYLQSGEVWLTLDGEKRLLLPGDMVEVPTLIKHQFGGIAERSEIFEFSTQHFEADSYREV